MCVDAGAAFALSSDAHVPEDIGHDYDRAVETMRDWGVDRDRRLRAPRAPPWSRSGCRVGIGYDSHRFADGRRLVLGGVEIEHEPGLEGHSDADVLTHAVIDAVLGAGGLGDLGTHFPPDDEAWRDADSLDLLRTVVGMLVGLGRQRRRDRDLRGAASSAAHRGEMERNLSEVLGAPVSVKAIDQRADGVHRPRRGYRLHRSGPGGRPGRQ